MYIDNSGAVMEILRRHNSVGRYVCGHNHQNDFIQKDGWNFVQLGAVPDVGDSLDMEIEPETVSFAYRPVVEIQAMDKSFTQYIPYFNPFPNPENGCRFENIKIKRSR